MVRGVLRRPLAETTSGRAILTQRAYHPGSLGIACYFGSR